MPRTLNGKHLLITSGPTRASLDAVRYITNRSSGRLGCTIATEALRRGARVTMVAGPDSVIPQRGAIPHRDSERLSVVPIDTVPDLIKALEYELAGSEKPDAVLHAMAVLDYVPERAEPGKTPSGRESWVIRLVPTPKVIRLIKGWAPEAYLVEFKLEAGLTEERLRAAALESLKANGADLVVANDLMQITAEAHPALIIASDGSVISRPATKGEIARDLCDVLAEALGSSDTVLM